MTKKYIPIKLISSLLLLCFFLFNSFTAFTASAEDVPYFTCYADKSAIVSNDEVRIKVNASENNLKENIAAFRITVNFDSTKLTFKRADTSSQVQDEAFQYHAQEDKIIGIYVCDGKTAPKLLGDCITFVFNVKEGASIGETIVSSQIDQIVDWSVHRLGVVCNDDVKLRIEPPLSSNALLSTLAPLQVALEPSFSPNVSTYSLYLPYSATSIEFNATAADDGTVHINRKSLEKAGTNTLITVTVTSADKKSKSQYFITVSRVEKEAAAVSGNQSRTLENQSKTNRASTNAQSKKQVVQNASQEDASSAQETGEQPADGGVRNLYMVGNQMPAYIVGMLLGIICILIFLLTYLFYKKDKKDKDNKNKK